MLPRQRAPSRRRGLPQVPRGTPKALAPRPIGPRATPRPDSEPAAVGRAASRAPQELDRPHHGCRVPPTRTPNSLRETGDRPVVVMSLRSGCGTCTHSAWVRPCHRAVGTSGGLEPQALYLCRGTHDPAMTLENDPVPPLYRLTVSCLGQFVTKRTPWL